MPNLANLPITIKDIKKLKTLLNNMHVKHP